MVKIEITPESIEEYEKRKGYKVEPVDMGEQNKGLVFECCGGSYTAPFSSDEEIKRLIDDGLEALVDANGFQRETDRRYTIAYYGLPVRKKK